MRLRNNRVDASVPNPLQLKSTEDHPSVVSRPGSSLAVTPIEEPEDNDHGLSNPLPSPTATNSKLPLNIDASQNESSEVRTSAVLNRPTSLKISIHQPLSIQHSTPTLPIESSGKHKWTRKWHQMMRVYFGESYEKQDVLVTTGLILILIGFGCTLIGFYVLFDEHYVSNQFHFIKKKK